VNYRDHRKIVVIDGEVGFVGGINVADRYINNGGSPIYWRDTHCMLEGEAVYSLQILFILNWYFVSKKLIQPDLNFFPAIENIGDVLTSIISSDPDSDNPNLMEGYFSMINSATEEILINTPYFIPNESVLTALKTAAKGGVKVVLLFPGSPDSLFVHSASLTYMGELLRNDIHIYTYTRGMIHSKVMIIDEELSTVGTANMDYRSFDNNAEVNAVFFDQDIAIELKNQFLKDLENAEKLDYLKWKNRSLRIKLIGSFGRLVAPLL
jgi:cardiolipin synthase